jgi:hypothetical protein
MKQIPILFSTEMVKAILEGRKTQTRRVVTGKHLDILNHMGKEEFNALTCHKGVPGDVLWVRENYRVIGWDFEDQEETFVQYTDGTKRKVCLFEDHEKHSDFLLKIVDKMQSKCEPTINEEEECVSWSAEQIDKFMPWKPSIHMPKATARIWLEITNVRVERLHDISEDDAKEEGVEKSSANIEFYRNYVDEGWELPTATQSFFSLWHSINGIESWKANPWAWVIEFKRIEKPKA